jgi:hypothetical protein
MGGFNSSSLILSLFIILILVSAKIIKCSEHRLKSNGTVFARKSILSKKFNYS